MGMTPEQLVINGQYRDNQQETVIVRSIVSSTVKLDDGTEWDAYEFMLNHWPVFNVSIWNEMTNFNEESA